MNIYRGTFRKCGDVAAGRGVDSEILMGSSGHAVLIQTLMTECAKRNLRSMIYTFENHPNHVIFKDKPTPLIMTEERKVKILEDTGVDELFLEHFDETYAHTAPGGFCKKNSCGQASGKNW